MSFKARRLYHLYVFLAAISFSEPLSRTSHEAVGLQAVFSTEDSLGHVWAVKLTASGGRRPEDIEKRAESTASSLGFINEGRVEPFRDIFQYRVTETSLQTALSYETAPPRDVRSAVVHMERSLRRHDSVVWAGKQRSLRRAKRMKFNDPAFHQQWHLVNKREVGHDINVTGVWSEGITGRGVVIAVVDDGLEWKNKDISQNYNSTGSYDFNSEDHDPSPNLSGYVDNAHGTKCAGLLAAVANNVCGVGVAYEAGVSGIRMLDGTVTDILEGKSFIYQAHINWIYSCSWGPEDNGKTVEGPGYVATEALDLALRHGRYGYGNIFVFASGNGGRMEDNCNYDGYANSIYTVTVGAVNENNRMPWYAELCPAMFGVTYSNGQGDRSVVTTDASTHGGCTTRFSGTSASAPIAAGMIALMLQVRRCLTWRDVQSVLAYTAVRVDVNGAEWVKNAAGFNHSDQHGFGLLDAFRMTRTAGVWPLLPPMKRWSSGFHSNYRSIPTNRDPLVVTIAVPMNGLPLGLTTLEHVAMTITLDHTFRGAIEISLKSPQGTLSKLATTRKHDSSSEGLYRWTFSSVKFWGESPIGEWTLTITDDTSIGSRQGGGTLNEWQLVLYGSNITHDNIALRRRLVEEAVGMDVSSWIPLPCPPLPSHPQELHLPETETTSVPMWENVILVVIGVVVVVVLGHLLVYWGWDCVRRRLWKPHLPTIRFTKRTHTGGDNEERTLLLRDDCPVRVGEVESDPGEEEIVLLPSGTQSDNLLPNGMSGGPEGDVIEPQAVPETSHQSSCPPLTADTSRDNEQEDTSVVIIECDPIPPGNPSGPTPPGNPSDPTPPGNPSDPMPPGNPSGPTSPGSPTPKGQSDGLVLDWDHGD